MIAGIFGEEVRNSFEREGFSFEVKIQADEGGRYNVVLGQVHTHTDEGINRAMTNGFVSSFQDTLYDLLPQINPTCAGGFFVEGIAFDITETKKAILRLRSRLEAFATEEITSINQAHNVNGLLAKFSKISGHIMVRNTDSIVLAEKITVMLDSYVNSFTPNSEEEKVTHEILLGSQLVRSFKSVSTVLSGKPTYDDAVMRLFMEDKIHVNPAEDAKINERAIAQREEAKAAKEAFENLFRNEKKIITRRGIDRLQPLLDKDRAGTISPEEAVLLKQGREEVIAEWDALEASYRDTPEGRVATEAEKISDEWVLEAREDAAMDWVEKLSPYDNACIVYGRAHDWHRAVTKINDEKTQKGEPKTGLIRIDRKD